MSEMVDTPVSTSTTATATENELSALVKEIK